MRYSLVVLFLLWAVPLSAQNTDWLYRASQVSVGIGTYADTATTINGLATGKIREANPFLVRVTTNPTVFSIVKAGSAVGVVWLTHTLENRKLATVINFAVGGFFTGIAIHNARLIRSVQP